MAIIDKEPKGGSTEPGAGAWCQPGWTMNQPIDPNVLVVDDDPEVLDMLTSALTGHHFQCTSAPSW